MALVISRVADELQPVALGLSTPAPANESSLAQQVIAMAKLNYEFCSFAMICMTLKLHCDEY